ncbi:hypothetical protein D3C87_309240 [compost metagenome]
MKKTLMLLMIICAGISIQSCKKNKGGSTGRMEVRMTDSPGDFTALHVQIMKIEAYSDNSGWVTVNETTKEINILSLTNGAEVTVASVTEVQVGLYTKLRLTFTGENSLSYNGSNGPNVINLLFSSSYSHQVEVPIQCQVNAGATASVLLDFNVALSVKEANGTYTLDPVLAEVTDPETGVQGHIDGSTQAAISLSNGSHTASTFTNADGFFMLRGVPDGTYLMKIEGKSAGDIALSQKSQNVTISKGQIKNIGSIQL